MMGGMMGGGMGDGHGRLWHGRVWHGQAMAGGYGNQGIGAYPQATSRSSPMAVAESGAQNPNAPTDLTGSYLGNGAMPAGRAISACRT